MKTQYIFPALVLACVALAGCGHSASNDGPYGAKGVDWYTAHKAERSAQLQWCSQQSADVQSGSAGCSQAGTADQKSWLNSNKTYVPGG